jgi:hypothetical protein
VALVASLPAPGLSATHRAILGHSGINFRMTKGIFGAIRSAHGPVLSTALAAYFGTNRQVGLRRLGIVGITAVDERGHRWRCAFVPLVRWA